MPSSHEELPDWERLLAAERHLQHLVPGAVLVGGTAGEAMDLAAPVPDYYEHTAL